MDPFTANVAQTAIISGMTAIIVGIVIGTRAWIRVTQIQADAQKLGGREELAAVDALRKEVADLRDTATRYDVSFDTALQRLEARVVNLETARIAARASESVLVQQLGGSEEI
jgi:hypothetical protein